MCLQGRRRKGLHHGGTPSNCNPSEHRPKNRSSVAQSCQATIGGEDPNGYRAPWLSHATLICTPFPSGWFPVLGSWSISYGFNRLRVPICSFNSFPTQDIPKGHPFAPTPSHPLQIFFRTGRTNTSPRGKDSKLKKAPIPPKQNWGRLSCKCA